MYSFALAGTVRGTIHAEVYKDGDYPAPVQSTMTHIGSAGGFSTLGGWKRIP